MFALILVLSFPPGHEGIAILMVPETSDLMRHYEEAAARGELEEEYDGLEITLEEAANAGVSFRPTGADDSFKEEYLFCKPACHLEVAMLVNGSEYVKVGDASILLRKDEVQANPVSEEFRWQQRLRVLCSSNTTETRF